jgi:hypothetical protein
MKRKIESNLLVIFVHEISEYLNYTNDLFEEIRCNHFISDLASIKVIIILEKLHVENGRFKFELSVYDFVANGPFTKERDITSTMPVGPEPGQWKFVLKYLFEVFPGDRKMLVTWSHGNGFGINFQAQPTVPVTISNPFISIQDKPRLFSKANLNNVIAMSDDYQNNTLVEHKTVLQCNVHNIIWVQDIADALKIALPDNKLDVLLMINCNMQTVDNAIILSPQVRYLVAPQSFSAYYCVSFKGILETMRKHPGASNRVLAKTIIDNTVQKFTFEIEDGRETMGSNSLIAVRLKFARIVLFIVNEVSETLLKLAKVVPGFREMLLLIRQENLSDTSGTVNIGLVDFGRFLTLIAKRFEAFSTNLYILEKSYKSTINKMVVAKFIGKNFLINDEYSSNKFGQSGFSIYFPRNQKAFEEAKSVHCVYYNVSTMSEFARLGSWDNLLLNLFTKTEQSNF